MRRRTGVVVPLILVLMAVSTVAVRGEVPDSLRSRIPVTDTARDEHACPISIYLKNTSSRKLALVQSRSQVRIRRGFWGGVWDGSNLKVTIYVEPGETKNTKASLTFGCSTKRRYRFWVIDPGRSASEYLYRPGTSSWTTDNVRFTIDLAKAF